MFDLLAYGKLVDQIPVLSAKLFALDPESDEYRQTWSEIRAIRKQLKELTS